MPLMQPNHIVDVFYFVDNAITEQPRPRGGRPKLVKDSEIITLLIWNCLSNTRQRTLKDVFRWALMYHHKDVPKLGTYGAFVAHCHRLIPKMTALLGLLLVPAKIQFIDSTKLPVCSNHRTNRYRVANKLAGVGKNWQGYWYGFKLHLAINGDGQISALAFTPADVYDGHVTEQLVRAETKIVVGDSHYGDKIQRAKLKKRGILVVAPPHWRQKTQIMAQWQQALLYKRSKIEATFDHLKEHLPLVSSFPRSVNGYLLHYIRILLGYQVEVSF
jgi:hypothetical protein